MHSKVVRFGLMLLLLSLCCFCQKNDSKDLIAKIDGTSLTRQHINAFLETSRMFPSATGEMFPGAHPDLTYLIDVELLYEKAKNLPEVANEKMTDDWKWKKMYFPAQSYLKKILDGNLGFTDKDIEACYKAHLASYKKTVKVGTDPKDTTVKVKIAQHDSSYFEPLVEVKSKIVDSLFLVKYPVPDSLLRKNAKDTVKIDTIGIKANWVYGIRRRLPDFFMREFYKERFKTAFPESLNVWYGDKKTITPADMKVITNWIPEDQRGYYSNPAGSRELAQWLLKWKLFSEKAKAQGFESLEDVKAMMDYAWKLSVALNYVNKDLIPKAKSTVAIDTEMCIFSFWDEHGNPSVHPDSASLKAVVNQYAQRAAFNKVESQIFDLRKKANVTVLQSDWKDDAQQNPVSLIAKADSLRDTGNTQGAENIYRTLTTTFSFTPEGIRAYTELAKILTEKQMYAEAIKNYRDYLILSNDKSKRCNTFFMIGFIHDEYLNKPDLAQVNYRWVLKNTPECELADDAEFMSLHLGEAMSSVEELRAEALRQGKKVDTSAVQEPAIPEAKADVKAKAKKK